MLQRGTPKDHSPRQKTKAKRMCLWKMPSAIKGWHVMMHSDDHWNQTGSEFFNTVRKQRCLRTMHDKIVKCQWCIVSALFSLGLKTNGVAFLGEKAMDENYLDLYWTLEFWLLLLFDSCKTVSESWITSALIVVLSKDIPERRSWEHPCPSSYQWRQVDLLGPHHHPSHAQLHLQMTQIAPSYALLGKYDDEGTLGLKERL